MNLREAEDFARKEMTEEDAVLKRAEPVGPFVVALVELAKGGFQNRAAQPGVVLRGRRSGVPEVAVIATHGPSRYSDAALRFNNLVDKDLNLNPGREEVQRGAVESPPRWTLLWRRTHHTEDAI